MMKSLSVLFFALGFFILAVVVAARFFFGTTDMPPSAAIAASRSARPPDTARAAQTPPVTEPSPSPVAASASSVASKDGTCMVDRANDVSYLIFWPPLPGADSKSLAVGEFATKLGTTGDGVNRQLGFGVGIPVWAPDDSIIRREIKQHFDTARRTNVAVHFNIDDNLGWEARPDLWNWYDPSRIGYDPENKNNVEWFDWEGTPNKRRYFSPEGTASQSPHMCYNSPAVQREIHRLVSEVVGPALREEIDDLKRNGKEYLFAGITVGAEAGFDDYSVISKVPRIPPDADPMQKQVAEMILQARALMDQDHAPYGRLGYCALSNAGYGKANPPADFNRALADINQKFLEFWDGQFTDAGISCSRIYTHVAASPPQDDSNNAPIGITFNPHARPGWTTYPIGTLAKGFQPLYAELAKHGNPAWGGVEANAALAKPNSGLRVSWEQYLAWHYNHGAKIVGINVGATDPSLMSDLSQGAFGAEAMATYKKFLSGEPLSEAAAPDPADTPAPPGQSLDKMHRELVDEVKTIQREAPAWLQADPGRQLQLGPLFNEFDTHLKADDVVGARGIADKILRMIRTRSSGG